MGSGYKTERKSVCFPGDVRSLEKCLYGVSRFAIAADLLAAERLLELVQLQVQLRGAGRARQGRHWPPGPAAEPLSHAPDGRAPAVEPVDVEHHAGARGQHLPIWKDQLKLSLYGPPFKLLKSSIFTVFF